MNSDLSMSAPTYEGPAVSRMEICGWYNITPKTFKKKCEDRGITLPPGIVCPKDVQRIFDKLGKP